MPRFNFSASAQFKTLHPRLKGIILTQAAKNHLDKYQWLHERINNKALWAELREQSPNRKDVYFVEWGRDCDHAEWSTTARPWYTTSLVALQRKVDTAIGYNSDEGPGGVYAVPFKDTDKYEAWSRDHVMESYENGDGYNVGTCF